ncbi:MAG: hypothetical protein ISR65_04305 [Bacteriovoracaceae bacterium]|nr:hypothetical protein [Bacteriovoracaceae bacterium]
MKLFISIIDKLGVDISIFYQFILLLVIYVILKHLLFDKLLFVLSFREKMTTTLLKTSLEKLENASNLEQEYQKKVDIITKAADLYAKNQREEIIKNQEDLFLEAVDNIVLVDQKQKIKKEYQGIELQVLKKKEELAQTFIDNMIENGF